MANLRPGVKPHMLYIRHALIDPLNSTKQTKTVKNAWIFEIDFKKKQQTGECQGARFWMVWLQVRIDFACWDVKEQDGMLTTP